MQKRDSFIFWLTAPPLVVIYVFAFVLFKFCGLPGLCSTTWHFNTGRIVSAFFSAIKNQLHPLTEFAYSQKRIFLK